MLPPELTGGFKAKPQLESQRATCLFSSITDAYKYSLWALAAYVLEWSSVSHTNTKSPDGSPVGDQGKSCIQIPALQEEEN